MRNWPNGRSDSGKGKPELFVLMLEAENILEDAWSMSLSKNMAKS